MKKGGSDYKETQTAREKYLQMGITNDMEIWLAMHGWKIRKLNVEIDNKPLAELIRLDEKLLVVINEKEKKMKVFKNQRFLRPRKQVFEGFK